jgi:hypothetical protein
LIADQKAVPSDQMAFLVEKKRTLLASGKKSGVLSRDDQYRMKQLIKILEQEQGLLFGIAKDPEAFLIIKKDYEDQVKKLKKSTAEAGKRLSNMFLFCEEVFPDGQEMLIIVTELTINPHTSGFINKYGCKEYFKHNKDLLVYDRQQEIEAELKTLSLD